jgi:hypothetical protein
MHGRSVSTVTAYTAHREWATRPPDERYASVHALAEAARARRIRTDARITETVDLRVQAATADALAISDRSGPSRALTHWSFEQLAGLADAPPAYLRTRAVIPHQARMMRGSRYDLHTRLTCSTCRCSIT